jgi:hypothetical protein
MTRVIVVAFILFCHQLLGREISWHQGSVVLINQQVLVGEISIQSSELVLFRNDDQGLVNVYPSHKIQWVRYYDEAADVNRKFCVINDSEFIFQHSSLYEIIITGKLDVIRKQRGLSKVQPISDRYDFDYFTLQAGVAVPLRDFKRKLYSAMMMDSITLQHYVKEQKLDPGNPADAIRIIMFFNTTALPFSASISH